MTPSAILALGLACAPNVAPSTLQSIVAQESDGNQLAINLNDGRLMRQPATKAEAVMWAAWLRAHGRNFDAGLMQVNSVHWDRLGLTAESIFDPCTNVRSGGQILTEAYIRAAKQYGPGSRALLAAISAYNTGSLTRGFHNGYVRNVLKKAGVNAGVPPIDDASRPAARRSLVLTAAMTPPPAAINWQAQPDWSATTVYPAQPTREP